MGIAFWCAVSFCWGGWWMQLAYLWRIEVLKKEWERKCEEMEVG